MFDLTGKNALVTGASGGIGGEIAKALHAAGATVGLSGTRVEPLEALAAELGERAYVLPANLSDKDSVEELPKAAIAAMGSIDILVNNAATNPAMGSVIDTEEKTYDHIIDTNLKGYFMLSKLVGQVMKEQKGGTIINVSSAGGVSPAAGLGPYCISKAGINMLTKQMAMELGPDNIRVNAIAPRIVKTGFSKALWTNDKLMQKEFAFTPLKCVATPEEIAQTALFLSSSATNYMTGHVMVLNGGAFF